MSAAYVEGGFFAALAFGEQQQNLHAMFTKAQRAAASELAWTIVTAPLGLIPASGTLRVVRDSAALSAGFVGPGGVDLEGFLQQPATGGSDAAFAVVAANIVPLVSTGVLPHPKTALAGGLDTADALAYVARLRGEQRVVWDQLVDKAKVGFSDVGDELDVVPGAPRHVG
jgi:hypothetical protein